MVEDLSKKFSLDANKETKIFHLDGGRVKEEILFKCEHFLSYARNENISPRPPPSTGRFKEEILCRCELFLCYARNKNISPAPPLLNWKI